MPPDDRGTSKSLTSRQKSPPRDAIEELKHMTKDLVLNEQKCRNIMLLLNQEIEAGLRAETHASATVKCFPTYVQNVHCSNVDGSFLVLDLGGTNLRIMNIELRGSKAPHIMHSINAVPAELKTGPGEALFDYIAICVWAFVKEFNLKSDRKFRMGFTFSFPLDQKGLRKVSKATFAVIPILSLASNFTQSGLSGSLEQRIQMFWSRRTGRCQTVAAGTDSQKAGSSARH